MLSIPRNEALYACGYLGSLVLQHRHYPSLIISLSIAYDRVSISVPNPVPYK